VIATSSKAYIGGLTIGQRQLHRFHGSGPTSYAQATGDVISTTPGYYFDYVTPCMDTTGTYIAFPFPSTVDTTRAAFAFKYYTAASMVAVPNATNLSAYNFEFMVFGGEF
jgi:hypothetical protein